MENKNQLHQTSHFVSHDAPHLGANVPLGVLYGLYGTMSFLENQKTIGHFVDKKSDTGTYLELAERIVHCNAARQMLVNYVDFGGNLNNSLHNSWQNELAELGFPQGDKYSEFKLIGIANGSYSNNDILSSYLNANFSASSDILDLVLPFVSGAVIGVALNDLWAGMLSLLPGKSTIKGHFEINAGTSSSVKITDMELKYKKKFAWVVNISRTVFSYKKTMPGGLAYDVFPSSYFSLGNEGFGINGGGGIPIVGGFDYNISVASNVPFVPTSSALCVGGGKKPLTQTLFTSKPSTTDIPFGDNYFFQENKSASHVNFDTKTFEWLVAQISYGIIGPKLGITGSKYRAVNLIGFPTNAKWSTDNSSIATIGQDGTLTVMKRGVVTITATINNVKMSKRIIVGTPRFILEDVKREPGFYRIKAKCIDTESGYADFILGNKNVVTYQWGVKSGDQAIQWFKSDSPELLVSTLEDKENTTIYLKVIDLNGNESSPIFVRITGYDIYDLGLKTLIFNSKGDVYSDKGVKLYYPSMSMPLIFRDSSQGEFNNTKWNPVAAVVVDDENMQRGILWNRTGYIKEIIPLDDIERIKTFTNNKVVIYKLMFLNFDGEIIQKSPLTIMYKANFPN